MRIEKKTHNTKNVLSFNKALLWIFVFTFFISGGASLCVLYYFHIREVQLSDHRYKIRSLIQEGEERIPTQYLAEILNLSDDMEMNLFAYNLDTAKKNLLSHALIKSAELRKKRPSSILITYEIRRPEFSLIDFQNTGVDKEGILFPLQPFYEENSLLKIYFGELELDLNSVWGSVIAAEKMDLALSIKEVFIQHEFAGGWILSCIDLSHAFSLSLGEKEVILTLTRKVEGIPLFLRMRTGEIHAQLQFFADLSFLLDESSFMPEVIDLRLTDLAFIKSI